MAQNEWWKQGATAVETQAPSADADWWKKGATPVDDQPAGATVGGRLKDAGLALAKGVVGVPEAAVGLADIVTGGGVGKALENEGGKFGFRPKQAKDYLSSLQSDAYKSEQQQFSEAEGIGGKALAALQNPALVANTVVESAPSMLGGAALARGAGMAVPAIAGRLGLTAAGEGAVMAGSQAEQIRQQTEDGLLTPAQAALAAGTGLVGGAAGALGSRAARALGVGDIDQMIASGAIKGSARQGLGIANRGARGALTEGVFEELPQSLAETGLQNIALDRPITQGMEESAVMGTLAGGVMGAGAGVVSGLGQKPPGVTEQEWQTILGAGDPDAIRPEVQPVEAPDLTTAPGAAEPRTGMEFTRDVDTSGLSLQDPAEIERARAQTIDFQRQDVTPEWETSQGAGVPREGLTMPPRQIDTSGLSLTPSEAMGIDPSAGPLSRAAASAVDSGATQAMQQAAAPQIEMNERQDGTLMVTGDFNAIRSQLVESGIPAQSIIRNMRGATVGRTQAQAARQALSTQQEAANVSTPAPVQRTTDTSAGTGSAQPETGVPAGVGSSERGTGLAAPDAELATSGDGSGRAMAAPEVDSPSLTTNVQNQPQGTTRAEAQSAPVEARAPARGDAATAGAVSAARDTTGMEVNGVSSSEIMPGGLTLEVAGNLYPVDSLEQASDMMFKARKQFEKSKKSGNAQGFIEDAPIRDGSGRIVGYVGRGQSVFEVPNAGPLAKKLYDAGMAAVQRDSATRLPAPAAAVAGDGQSDGVKRQENKPKADTSAEPAQKTAKTEQVAKAPAEPAKPEPAPQQKAEKPQDAQFSVADAPPFYSALRREIESLPTKTAPAMGWSMALQGLVKNGKVKADELEWTGITEWLKLQTGKVSKEDVLSYLDANGVQVTETVLGGKFEKAERLELERLSDIPRRERSEAQESRIDELQARANGEDTSPTKYSNYTLPGGTNYREVLLTLPARVPENEFHSIAQMKDWLANNPRQDIDSMDELSKFKKLNAERRKSGKQEKSYKSSHWDQPNVLAHIRVNDRVDADGKRVLFVEELQSDWGQDGKKKGFSRPNDQKRADELLAKQDSGQQLTDEEKAEARALSSRIVSPIPAAPFVDKTDKWLSLSLKRIMKMAVDGGYDRVAFVNGEQSAERYDLSKQISEINYEPAGEGLYEINAKDMSGKTVLDEDEVTLARIEELVGKEIAKKIEAGEGEKSEGGYRDWHKLSGLDLKVGGEGMKAFYDKIVPAALKDVLKKVGDGQVESVQVGKTFEQYLAGRGIEVRDGKMFSRGAEMNDSAVKRQYAEEFPDGALTQPGFTINQSMREKVAGGLPLFRISDTNATTNAAYPPASQAHQKAATAFAERLSKNRDSFVLMDAVKPTGARAKEAQSVSDLAKTMFGREVVFVQFKGRPLFNGAVSTTDPGKVFVNIESARPMMAVLGHELLHELRKSNPAAYNQLAKTLKNVTKDDYIYAALLKQKYSDQGLNWTPQDISEELYGDIVGDNFMDPKFWEALAGDKPILAKQLYRAVMNWLDKIASMFKRVKVRPDGRMVMTLAEQADGSRPFGTQKYLQDIEAARAAVAQAMGQFKQGGNGKDALSIADGREQTDTQSAGRGESKSNLRAFLAGSKVRQVVYHATRADFNAFDTDKSDLGAHFGNEAQANRIAGGMRLSNAEGTQVMPVWLSIKNPIRLKDVGTFHADGIADQLERKGLLPKGDGKRIIKEIDADWKLRKKYDPMLRKIIQDAGYDGVVYANTQEAAGDSYIAFRPEQIKSATGNRGTFDPENPDIRFSIADAAGKGIDRIRQATNAAAGKNVPRAATMSDLDAEQKAFLNKTGPRKTPSTDVIKAATDRAGLKIRQGVIDRYAALKELDEKALGKDFIGNAITDSSWVLAKMSSAGSGALNAMMTTGRIEFDDKQKVIGIKGDATGGLTATLKKLGGPDEVERFFGWIAANRAEKLLGEGRENLFTPDEIKAAKRLNEGKTEEGKSRSLLYTQAFKEFQEYRDDVLAIAEKSGIISDETRALWRDEFYVPFYRVMQDDGKTGGPGGGKGLSRQEAFKKLKGGSENLNDLMENTLMNFHHLLSASLKNQAASQAIRNAEKVGIANPVPESRRDTDKSTFVLKNGQKVYYEIDDPLVFESITSLSDPGLNNFAVRTMSAFKRVFTNLTTVTPQFVIANTFRDLLQASATSPTSKNVALNAVQGLKTYRDQKTRAEMLASGGAFSFGHIYGMDPDEVKASLRKTVKGADLISDPSMIPGILRKGWKHWNDAIDTSENISRAATYAQNVEGLGKLRAAFEARDVMDFSQHGAWPAVRLLVRVVPFLNARLQGLDKLYRSGVKPSILTAMGKGTDTDKQAAARFATVAGSLAVATMALYMVNADDEEYQKLEEWQKDTYWFFRIGDNAFFLPKPFEVGAIATLAERTLQQFMDDKATGKLFGERVKEMLMQTFAFNPVPQMFQPIVDVYANRDAFTGRDIETMGMERLSPGLRARDTTTAVGRGLSAATRVFGDESAIAVSPVQADHLIKGYLGGVGASSAGILDTMYRTATGQESPDKRLSEYQPIRRFYRDLGAPAPNSRYSTLFYDGLREANRVYADVMELQKLGKTEEARELRTEKQNVLRMRQQLNAQQRRLSDINQRMQTVRRADKDGEWKRREIDMLNTQKALITERMGKMIEIVRAE